MTVPYALARLVCAASTMALLLTPGCARRPPVPPRTDSAPSAAGRAHREGPPTGVIGGKRPAILLVSPAGETYVDRRFLRELSAQGFEIDWTDSLTELSAERARAYNTLVLFTSPAAFAVSSGVPQPSGLEETFTKVVTEFVGGGGGVLLMPEETNVGVQRLRSFTDRWGAQVAAERIVETDARRSGQLARGSYHIRMAYTDEIAKSPITSGISGLWYPLAPAFLGDLTLPLVVNESWTVLVRGSKSSHTEAVDLASSFHAAPGLLQRKRPETSPALFAVRQAGEGRVALTAQWPQFSFSAGTKWLYDSVVLERGLGGLRSDYARLLVNTLSWLSEPSVTKGSPGGFRSLEQRPTLNERPELQAMYRSAAPGYSVDALLRAAVPGQERVFRGLIGARTRRSGGSSEVADYARAARRSALDFIVFLEDFAALSEAEFASLKQECAAHSSSDLLLLPGFSAVSNIGNSMFFFGPQLTWPPDSVLTGAAKRTIYYQLQSVDGAFTGANRTFFLEWALSGPQVGFFNFNAAPEGLRLYDARTFSMAGIRYYRSGVLVEDVVQDYLLTNAATIGPTPAAIHLVKSAEDLTLQAKQERGLTYVVAGSLTLDAPGGVFRRGLRFKTQFDTMSTFVSSGPQVLSWPATFRALSYGGEGFAPERSLMFAPIALRSKVGLSEYAIYDGAALFRRVALHGAKEHQETLVLDGGLQRDLVLIATDEQGGSAISFPLRSLSDGSAAPMFCSDHINDCRSQPLLARGPFSLPMAYVAARPADEVGPTWDGGPYGAVSALGSQDTLPLVTTEAGVVAASRMTAIPSLELSDEGVTGVTTRRTRTFDDRVSYVTNVWCSYGPLSTRKPLFEHSQHFRLWLAHSEAAPPYGHAAFGVRHGANASLFTSSLNYLHSATVKSTRFASFAPPVGARMALFPRDDPARTIPVGDSTPREIPFAVGDAVALYGDGTMNAHLLINRGSPLQLRVGQTVELWSTRPARNVRAGDDDSLEVASIGLPLDPPVKDAGDLVPILDLLREVNSVQVLRGTRLDSAGLIDLLPNDGSTELASPRFPFRGVLPVRMRNMNARWSAGVLLLEGNVAGFYGAAANRYRALGVSADGVAYLPLDAFPGATRVLAGHPIVASAEGKDLFVQVTCLGGSPLRWHVSVNNAGKTKVKTLLRQAMALPGLSFGERWVSLAPGELLTLQ